LFVPERSWATIVTAGLGTLRRATTDRRKIRFRYTRRDGEVIERTVRPLGLYFWGSSWSLAAWCEWRQDYRNFRPDRMEDLRLLDDVFDVQDGISLQDFLLRMEDDPRS